MADVKENAMEQIAVPAFLRCLDSNGSSKLVTPSNAIGGNSLKNAGMIDGGMLYTYINAYGYASETDNSGISGEFITFGIENRQVQFKIANDANSIKFRTIKDGAVGLWKSINIT